MAQIVSSTSSKFLFSLLIFLSILLYCLYYNNDHIIISSLEVDNNPGWLKRMSVPVKWPPPVILMWTKFFSDSMTKKLTEYNNITNCIYKCHYTDDRSLENKAALLVFHARDNIDVLPLHRTPQQLYTFFVIESPHHTWGMGRDVPPDFFNISFTYRSDSDVHYTYGMFEEYKKEDLEGGLVTQDQIWTEKEIDSKITKKEKLALQFVSNCNTKSKREKYVAELKRYTDITQIGGCFKTKEYCDDKCADDLIDSHYFYFSFENSVCFNYVTEKFWKLKKLIVPVILSRSVVKGLNIPADSFIAADDFNSPKDLILFLKAVAADKNKYKSYFGWTKKFKKSNYADDASNPLCNLCKLAHINQKKLRIKDIYDFWNNGGKCQQGFAENVLLKG